MIVSHALKCIFVHIQKTGGSSIDRAIRDADPSIVVNRYDGRRHIPARDFREIVGETVWRRYFKFAFVRNPWDRLVSWHQMCLDLGDNPFQRHVRENFPTFSGFVTGATEGPAAKVMRSQLDFIVDRDGAPMVDFVGRFESFGADYETVAATIGLTASPKHLNRSAHGNYRTYYDDRTRAIVADRFRRDIEHFGYTF